MRGVVCLLAAGSLTACASPRRSIVTAPPELDRYIAAVRSRAEDVKPPAHPDRAVTLESTDREIKAAQLNLSVFPTGAAHRRLAEAYARRRVLDAAYDQFSAALAIDPRDAAAFDGRARVWREWGFPNLGLNDIHRAIYYAPASAVPLNTLGTLLLSLGQTADARRVFGQAILKDPAATYATNNLCFATVVSGDGPAAVAACERAADAQPGPGVTRTNLALAHVVAGDLPTALRLMSRQGRSTLATYDLGEALLGLGRYPEAAAAFDEAAQGYPGFTAAIQRARTARRLAARTEGVRR